MIHPDAPLSLSVVLINYNLDRELPRTLFSLSAQYQRGVSAAEYEVLVVDNGSRQPFSSEALAAYGPNFRSVALEQPRPSPVFAINAGAAQARGRMIAVMIDGARMLSPGVIRLACDAAQISTRAIVAVPNWHLGPDVQHHSVLAGYDQQVEDRLLESVPWRTDGYELFRIATLAPATQAGLFINPNETCFLGLSRELFLELGGYDEKFDLPGGGLVNRDTLRRALTAAATRFFLLFGEGNFHQFHGGISTGRGGSDLAEELKGYREHYLRVRGFPTERIERTPDLLGHVPRQLGPALLYSMNCHFPELAPQRPAWRRLADRVEQTVRRLAPRGGKG